MKLALDSRWGTVPMKHIAAAVVSKANPQDQARPYVGLEHIESGTGRLLASGGDAEGESANLFALGDVLFGKLRPYLAKVLQATFDGRCTSEALVLRPHRVTPSFLRHVCLSRPFLELVNSSTYGAQMPRAGWDFVGRVEIPCPPPQDQRAIADFLDKKTAAIDALIAKKERLIELLQEKRHALITQAVTRGLDPTVPMKDSGVEWIGKTPAHWEVKRIKHVARLETGHTPRKTEESYWVPEECVIPWVSLNDTKALDANDYISDTSIKISAKGMANSSAHLIDKGLVVMNRDGARVGLAAITTRPMAVSQHIIGWLCSQRLQPEYLLHALYAMKPEIYRITAGATIPTIGMPDVRRMTVPVPPTDEQGAIVWTLVEVRQRVDHALETIRHQAACLREYRQALITVAVTGKLDVSKEAAA